MKVSGTLGLITTFFFRWVAPLVVLGSAGWAFYAMGTRQKPERKKPPPRKSIPVQIVQAKPYGGTLNIEASGVAIPYREVNLAARVGGEVIFKSDSLTPGHSVTKGELLLKLDPADYELAVEQFQQEAAKIDVDLAKLKIDKENAQRMLNVSSEMVAVKQREADRLKQLQRSNAASQSEIDTAASAYLTAKQQTTEHENKLLGFADDERSLKIAKELVKLKLRAAELNVKRAVIRAPFSGVVIANHVEQNGHVNAGMPIATIEDTSMIEVRCSLRTQDIGWIQSSDPAQPVYASSADLPKTPKPIPVPKGKSPTPYDLPPFPVTLEYKSAGQIYRWRGVLSRQDGLGIDKKTRTMPVRIRVDSPAVNLDQNGRPPVALLRGMFVKTTLHCQPRRPLLVIPESVIRPGKTVWLVKDGALHTEPVNVAHIVDGEVFIDPMLSSLTANDQIISTPVPGARDGLPVSLAGNPKRGKRGGPRPGIETTTKENATTKKGPPAEKRTRASVVAQADQPGRKQGPGKRREASQ